MMSGEPKARHVESTYLRLGSDASMEALPVDGSFWQRLQEGQLGRFHNEYLVSTHSMNSDWGVWEMHPKGDEMVCLLAGKATFILETGGGERSVHLEGQGDFLVVPVGADLPEQERAL